MAQPAETKQEPLPAASPAQRSIEPWWESRQAASALRCGIVRAMAVRRCPKCGLINPETAVACDCGWSFVRKAMGAPRQLAGSEDELRRARRSRATVQLVVGGVLVFLGIAGGISSQRPTVSSIVPADVEASSRLDVAVVASIVWIIGIILIIRGRRNMGS